jgi:cobalamin biosynthesis protein CobD/CbiB
MKNAAHSSVHTFRKAVQSLVQTQLDSLFKPALLRSETSTVSESSIDEYMYCLLYFFE